MVMRLLKLYKKNPLISVIKAGQFSRDKIVSHLKLMYIKHLWMGKRKVLCATNYIYVSLAIKFSYDSIIFPR